MGAVGAPSVTGEHRNGDPLPCWALLPGSGAQEAQNHPKTGLGAVSGGCSLCKIELG